MLTELPDVVIDLILRRFIPVNDLRALHQVSTRYRDLINSRPLVNAKRLALVASIRNDKENVVPHRLSNRSRPSSRSSSTESLHLMNRRVLNRLKTCKPFQELNENSILSDGGSPASINSSPVNIAARINQYTKPNSHPLCKTSNASLLDNTPPAKCKTMNSLGNAKKKKCKASLRRIANL